MQYTEYVVNMQKMLSKQHTPLSWMQLESSKKMRPYLNSKAYIIRQVA